MGLLPILIGLVVLQVTWLGFSDGAAVSTVQYHRPHGPVAGARAGAAASGGIPPVKPLPRKGGPTSTPPTAKAPTPTASSTATASASAKAQASVGKEDRYLHSLTKITTFMVKLNSFLELTIGSITKQLTDLTSQMAEVRGSLENLVNNTNTQPSIPSIPPPVPVLPVLNPPTTPKPSPPPPPPPQPKAKQVQRPVPRPAPRPAPNPIRPTPVRQPIQRYMPSYPIQFKPAVVPAARKPAITQQRRVDYYPGSRDKSLRWPGNNEFHPWWKNWWSSNFQGFYPETSGDTSSAGSFGSRRSQFGSTNQLGSQFGGQSSFGDTSQFGATSQFGGVPQYSGSKFGATSQFGSVPQYGGSQFGSFGSYPGGSAAAWMSASRKSREPGESEGKGRSSAGGSAAEY